MWRREVKKQSKNLTDALATYFFSLSEQALLAAVQLSSAGFFFFTSCRAELSWTAAELTYALVTYLFSLSDQALPRHGAWNSFVSSQSSAKSPKQTRNSSLLKRRHLQALGFVLVSIPSGLFKSEISEPLSLSARERNYYKQNPLSSAGATCAPAVLAADMGQQPVQHVDMSTCCTSC